jgi:cysteine-rich repeat protein
MRSPVAVLLSLLAASTLAACSSSSAPVTPVTPVAACGNGIVEAGEGCDDSHSTNGDGCSAACVVEAGFTCTGSPSACTNGGAGCGDGVRSGTEQCDDGGHLNLDGCDASCRFEQVLRANQLVVAADTSATCPANAFGGAVPVAAAWAQFNAALAAKLVSGDLGLMLQLSGLDDLSGGADASLELGVFSGLVHPATTFDNGLQRDQWFSTATGSVGPDRLPLRRLAGAAAGGVITAGPGRIDLPFSLLSAVQPLALAGARIRFTAAGLSTPAASLSSSPPGHLAGEHLLPSLQSFQAATGGELCGGMVAGSLAKLPIAPQLRSFCSGYAPAANFLDLLVGGCSGLSVATQPDGVDPAAPALGQGGPYLLVADAGKTVVGCKDKTGAAVDLAGCLAAATYSSRLTFTADRVIVRPACGDGQVAGGEQCDDGNRLDGDGCSSTCTVETGFLCVGAPSVCTATCGDGKVAGGEACDDGNNANGDGCSAMCQVEPGYRCVGSPSVCTLPVCGDGVLDPGEQCDDGNLTAGDGCAPTCLIEAGYSCSGSPSVCVASACIGVTCAALDSCHDAGTCNPATGACSSPAKADGTACNDGDACTTADACQAGVCVGSSPLVCTALDSCHDAGTCNSATGACSSPAKADGTACGPPPAACRAGVCIP